MSKVMRGSLFIVAALVSLPGIAVTLPAPMVKPAPLDPVLEVRQPEEEQLLQRRMGFPLPLEVAAGLSDQFNDWRRTQRPGAIELIVPQGTPVLAVDDGKIERFFTSRTGGLTIYQYDPTGTYAYAYAHLDRYAEGLREGQEVKRGQVIGYVGYDGKEEPHLNFALFELDPSGHWYQGTAVNPYRALRLALAPEEEKGFTR
jgi:murein DD-endopeptidase MepM/ murein hydrolase activator NlpD